MKIFAFLIGLIPLFGSALMFFEASVLGRLLSGEKLTPLGKRWLRRIALWGLAWDATMVGGAVVRSILRLSFYRKTKRSLFIEQNTKGVEKEAQQAAVAMQGQASKKNQQVQRVQMAQRQRQVQIAQNEEEEQTRLSQSSRFEDRKPVSQASSGQRTNQNFRPQVSSASSNGNQATTNVSKVNPNSVLSQRPVGSRPQRGFGATPRPQNLGPRPYYQSNASTSKPNQNNTAAQAPRKTDQPFKKLARYEQNQVKEVTLKKDKEETEELPNRLTSLLKDTFKNKLN